MRPADRAWLGIAVGVTCYEVAACLRGWELLSTALDRYRAEGDPSRRRAINAFIGYMWAHLTRRIPPQVDPLARVADWLVKLR